MKELIHQYPDLGVFFAAWATAMTIIAVVEMWDRRHAEHTALARAKEADEWRRLYEEQQRWMQEKVYER